MRHLTQAKMFTDMEYLDNDKTTIHVNPVIQDDY